MQQRPRGTIFKFQDNEFLINIQQRHPNACVLGSHVKSLKDLY
ncbi:MAG: hypothetical protein VB140_07510 [Burkholderia sp.]